jgi:cell division protein FtsN
MVSDTVDIPATGVTAELYRAAIGPRGQDYYLRQFAKFDSNGKTSATWHWPAYWATLNWLIYRKMWGWALAYTAALLGLALLIFGVGKLVFSYSDSTGIILFLVLMTGAFILPGLYANAWFYAHCNEKISAALRSSAEIKDACDVLGAQASSSKRWFTLASVNVAVMALLAGAVTFALHPTQEAPLVAQASQSGAVADSTMVATQPVAASANTVRPETQPVALTNPSPAVPMAAPSEPAPPSVAVAVAKPEEAPPKVSVSTPVKVEPVAARAKPKPAKPVQVAAVSADEPPAAAVETHPVAVEPPKAPPPKAPKVKHTWLVQVGAFANESNAQNVRAKVEETGLQTSAEPFDAPSGRLTRVRVGPFDSKAEADKAALRLKALDLPTVLIRQ